MAARVSATRDEMVDGSGRLRPQWDRLLGALAQLGPDGMADRLRALDSIVAEEGAAGLLPGGAPATRRLDPVPLPIGAAEFAALEAGLAQRARLLDLVLRDIYGRQALLADGVLPPALIFANPGFLRPCRAMDDGAWPGGQRLHVYAAELLRGPDGRWHVLSDRTADAAGMGYALLNRRALTRVMPEIFQSAALRRLRPFFEAWHDALQRIARPEAGHSPNLALLTPGPQDKLWFEHVVLARELSCELVEGGDLTARDGALYLKTLRGLRRVDVLIRREDGRLVDPLELEPGSAGGVPGLLDTARRGGVRMVNDPGAGLAEAPALAAFLPDLARHLLGEELRLPSQPVLWLGEEAARARVMADPAAWCLRAAFDGTAAATPLAGMDAAMLVELTGGGPERFVAQARPEPSIAPWTTAEGGMEPRAVVLRLFLVFDGTGWRCLPGGLARAVTEEDMLTGRLPLHALAKDVWVMAGEESHDLVGPANLSVAALPIRRATGDLPSRVADNFFWLGRYLERLDAAARLLRTTALALERPAPTPRERAELRCLGALLADARLLDADEAVSFGTAVGEDALAGALLSVARTNGALIGLVNQVSRIGASLRDRMTNEVHLTLTHGLRTMRESLRRLRTTRDRRRAMEPFAHAMSDVLTFCAAVSGLAAENMVRGGGRLFLDLGRRIERGQAIAGELALLLGQRGIEGHAARIEPVLRLALELRDSVITYRARYLGVLQPGPVLDLVLADGGNPRGLAFQLAAARDLLAELAGEEAGDAAFAATAAALLAAVEAMVRDVVAAPAQARAACDGAVRLKAVADALGGLSNEVTRRYFALLPAVRQLGVEGSPAPVLRGAA